MLGHIHVCLCVVCGVGREWERGASSYVMAHFSV
jgi:hypothetical protein